MFFHAKLQGMKIFILCRIIFPENLEINKYLQAPDVKLKHKYV